MYSRASRGEIRWYYWIFQKLGSAEFEQIAELFLVSFDLELLHLLVHKQIMMSWASGWRGRNLLDRRSYVFIILIERLRIYLLQRETGILLLLEVTHDRLLVWGHHIVSLVLLLLHVELLLHLVARVDHCKIVMVFVVCIGGSVLHHECLLVVH